MLKENTPITAIDLGLLREVAPEASNALERALSIIKEFAGDIDAVGPRTVLKDVMMSYGDTVV